MFFFQKHADFLRSDSQFLLCGIFSWNYIASMLIYQDKKQKYKLCISTHALVRNNFFNE